jgi:hypothetical protein
MRRLEAEVSEVPDNELIELLLRDVGLEYIPKCAIMIKMMTLDISWKNSKLEGQEQSLP